MDAKACLDRYDRGDGAELGTQAGGGAVKKNAPVSRVVATFGRVKFVSLAFVLGVMGRHKRQKLLNRNR
jgi:hypothetical protein